MGDERRSAGTVLVVDDEKHMRVICSRALAEAGYAVRVAENGELALKELEREPADLVLTDVTMPGAVDGQRLLKEIRQCSGAVDVIVMTAHNDIDQAVRALRGGASDFILKPFELDFLQETVDRCFERRRLSKELDREKLLRQELQAAYSELEKVERTKDALLSMLSHELRTPVAAAIMGVECLEGGSADDELVNLIRASLDRLKGIIEELLLHASLQKNGLRPEKTAVDLAEVVRKALKEYAILIKEKELAVATEFPTGSGTVRADAKLVEEAVRHLILNAIHFNRMGGKIAMLEDADGHRLTVTDTGIGIPEDKLGNVFDCFYQAADYMTRDVGGLGLGLAIVRRIAEAHGGGAFIRSKEGEGTTFTLQLPK